MPIIYDLTIELEEKENPFRITWLEREKKEQTTFSGRLNIPEEIFAHWEKTENHLIVGQALFDFLDGDDRFFVRALNQASKQGEKLQVHLRTCKETADWPFELLANEDEFLLLEKVLLVRQVSDRGCERKVVPGNHPLRILFMACDPVGMESGLNYQQEEEVILEITGKLPVQLEVEDSGSLKGLQQRLIHKYYDIIHLSGHANIDGDNKPFFYMEGETGNVTRIYPEMLYNEALIENLPRLLFMSGCRSGQMTSPEKSAYVMAFTRRMVEDHNISAVLGWGRSVKDLQANVAEKIIYQELSRGKILPEAVQQARYEMKKEFDGQEDSDWPLLRLYCDGTPHIPMVKIEQRSKPNSQQTTYTYLSNSNIKLLKEGFIGRRRQIQLSLKTLDEDDDKVGILLLGIGGLGKSCLAGKICERFPGHTVIAVQGKLDEFSLGKALNNAFITSQDKTGQRILAKKEPMADKLADLCATSFKERNYILLLDAFEQNLENTADGLPGLLQADAVELLHSLLYYLPYCCKMSHLIITSRFAFKLTHHERNLVDDRLQKIGLTSFLDSEIRRKVKELINIDQLENPMVRARLINTGYGNPFLLEEINHIAGEIPAHDTVRLETAIEKIREDFIQEQGLYELYQRCSVPLQTILKALSIYSRPVPGAQIPQIEKKTRVIGVKDLLKEGMDLSLVEYEPANNTYNLTPLLKEKLKR